MVKQIEKRGRTQVKQVSWTRLIMKAESQQRPLPLLPIEEKNDFLCDFLPLPRKAQMTTKRLWVVTFDMTPRSSCLFVFISVLCTPGVKLSEDQKVFQEPHRVVRRENDQVTLSFRHEIQNYDTIQWYRHLDGATTLELIALVNYKEPSVMTPFRNLFNGKKRKRDRGKQSAIVSASAQEPLEDRPSSHGPSSLDGTKDEALTPQSLSAGGGNQVGLVDGLSSVLLCVKGQHDLNRKE